MYQQQCVNNVSTTMFAWSPVTGIFLQEYTGSETKLKPNGFTGDKSTKVICYHCKKPVHIISACRKRQTKESQDQSSVRLVSTLPNTEPQVCGKFHPYRKIAKWIPIVAWSYSCQRPTVLVTWCVHYGILELYNL